MLSKKRIYLLAILLVVFFATIMIVFFVNTDTKSDYKGTLVKGYSQEALI
ncbi:MAG: hypothetical protein K0S41_459 [Anaerocolumna sp.]|jgi:hypothetical protein|nr:hypothetical protein [Anaerocolumna sp.]